MFEERLCKAATPHDLPTTVEERKDKLPKQAQGAQLWALRKLETAEPTIPSPVIVLTRGLNTDDLHKEVAAGFAALSRDEAHHS